MTANNPNPENGQERTDRDASADEYDVLFDTADGVFTHADLGYASGTSPVRLWAWGTTVHLELNIGASTVTTQLTPDRADELGDALRHAANKMRARAEAEADE
jgi:hypothetical protein